MFSAASRAWPRLSAITTATGSPTWRTRSSANTGCGGSFIGEPSLELISQPQGSPPILSALMSLPVNTATTPGDDAVFTGKDMSADNIGGLPCGWLINSKDGSPMKEPPHPVLALDRLRHGGPPVARVVGGGL